MSSPAVSTCTRSQDLGVTGLGGDPEVECRLEISFVLPILGKFRGASTRSAQTLSCLTSRAGKELSCGAILKGLDKKQRSN